MMGDGSDAAAGPEASVDGALSDSYVESTRITPEESNQVTRLIDVEDAYQGFDSLP